MTSYLRFLKETFKHLYPNKMKMSGFYGRNFLQKQDEKTLHSQSYGRFLSRRLWEKDQAEKPVFSFCLGIKPGCPHLDSLFWSI